MRFLGPVAFISGASAFLAPGTSEKAPYHVPDSFELVPNTYIVRLYDNHTLEDHFTNIGVNVAEIAVSFTHWPRLNTYHFTTRDNQSEILHSAIRHDPGVRNVHHDYFLKIDTPSMPDTPVIKHRQEAKRPSRLGKRWKDGDMFYRDAQWNQAMISSGWMEQDADGYGAKSIYDRTDMKYNAVQMSKAGKGVNIYFFDSGIRLTHEEFSYAQKGSWFSFTAGSKVRNFGNLPESAQSPYCGGKEDGTMRDDMGHGTHVAGIAVGKDGTAFSARGVSVKVSCAGATAAKVAQAVDDVVSEHLKFKENPPFDGWRGSVMNWSIDVSVPPSDDLLQRSLARAAKEGIPIAAAAGNEDMTKLAVPAKYKSTFSVGAVNHNYQRWVTPARGILPQRGSNFHSKLDAFAPGATVKSASGECGECYIYHNGTSQASPHVAGIMAIMIGYEGIKNLDHANTVYKRLKDNTLDLVEADFFMKAANAPIRLAQTGIRRNAKHPYRGVPESAVIPRDSVNLVSSRTASGLQRRESEEARPEKILPSPEKNSDEDMHVGVEDKTPPAPTWKKCYDVQADHDVAKERITILIEGFCDHAQAAARPDEGSNEITLTYDDLNTKNRPDELKMTIEYDSEDVDFEVTSTDCFHYLKELLFDECNANNAKGNAGGVIKVGQVEYRLETTKGPAKKPKEPEPEPEPEEPKVKKTPLRYTKLVCNDEKNFPGHADIGNVQVYRVARDFCMSLDPKLKLGPKTGRFEGTMEDQATHKHRYSISWVEGCVTDVDEQVAMYPWGNSRNDCRSILIDTWEDCTGNGGVGGAKQMGCLLYKSESGV